MYADRLRGKWQQVAETLVPKRTKKIGFWVFLAVEINHGLIKTLSGGTRIRGIMTTSDHLHWEKR